MVSRLTRSAVTAAASAALIGGMGGGSAAATPQTLPVAGTVLVVPSEAPTAEPTYLLQTDDGDLLRLDADFGEDVAGSRFRGHVRTPWPSTSAGEQLRRADRLQTAVDVASYALAAPEQTAAAAATHRWFVAVPGNFGALGMTDAQVMAKVGWAADFWTAQANGAIADIAVPAGITRYTATATSESAGCGLSGSDFSATVTEAAAKFPGANFSGGDQLLVLVPPSCASGGTTGRGTIGAVSFARGGYSISKADPAIFEWTLAHELGHNYGYGHAALGPCTPTCAREYGDYYSVMGGVVSGLPVPPALGTRSRRLQGILDPGEVETITGGDTTTTLSRTLNPRSASSGLRSLSLTDPSTGAVYDLDYRSGGGVDAGSYYTLGTSATSYRKGIVVEIANGSNAITLLPDAAGRKAMVPGDSFSLGDLTVTVNAMSTTGATVSVTVPGGVPDYPTVGAVSLSAPPRVGVSVSAALSGWSPAPASASYEWLADGIPIPGASGSSYVPAGGLAGRQLGVRVTAVAPGYQPALATSPSGRVATGTISLTGAVGVDGDPRVGSTLTCRTPTVHQPATGVATAYSWTVAAAPLASATNETFTPGADQLGQTLGCQATLTAPGYASVVAAATAAAPVAKGLLTTSKPTIRGRHRVGRTLRIATGAWTPGTTLRYRWFVAGQRVRRAHGPTLKLAPRMAGDRVKAVVVGKQPGYATGLRKSRATLRVRPA